MKNRNRIKIRAGQVREWAKRPIHKVVPTSRYLKQAAIESGDRIIIMARISNDEDKDRLNRQTIAIRQVVEAAGGTVVETFTRIGPTWGRDHYDYIRKVARYARRHKAIVVAETADRWCRSYNYTKREQFWVPDSGAFSNLLDAADGVQLHTLHDPDLSPKEVRSIQTKGGHRRTGNKGGRPPKKTRGKYKTGRKDELLPKIIELMDQGVSQRKISKVLNVEQSQISRWLKPQYQEAK